MNAFRLKQVLWSLEEPAPVHFKQEFMYGWGWRGQDIDVALAGLRLAVIGFNTQRPSLRLGCSLAGRRL